MLTNSQATKVQGSIPAHTVLQRGISATQYPEACAEPRCTAALRLHQYLVIRHWTSHALVGPDVGIRLNYRIGRFIKGYLPQIKWSDSYSYVQGQGYWILANWKLYLGTGEERFRRIATRCSDYLLTEQRADGAWIYPNPEWRGRIATAEGTWGALGLLESYRQTGSYPFLASAIAWHRFMAEKIGFQQIGAELAVNYFYARTGARVPNNSAFVLRFLAELFEVTGTPGSLQPCDGMLAFLEAHQLASGEFPYTVRGGSSEQGRPHFQCYQYNAFQCLDLMRYYEITGNRRALLLIENVLRFLRTGLAGDGHAFFDCHNRRRRVIYHTAVLANALARAREVGIGGYELDAERAYAHLLASQRLDGGFDFSHGDYRVLSDRRSYPRNLAMILYHLLSAPSAQTINNR